MIGNNDSEYADRVKTIKNDGEYLFEKYCKENDCVFHKIGFDENEKNVPNFWKLNNLLRNLPDYVITSKEKTFVVAVKGTDKFKQKEFDLLPRMKQNFNSEQAPFIYAFCFKENPAPIWMYPNQIIELYEKAEDEKWHDGIIYRNLNIRRKK